MAAAIRGISGSGGIVSNLKYRIINRNGIFSWLQLSGV
jgi:hypothetical protein